MCRHGHRDGDDCTHVREADTWLTNQPTSTPRGRPADLSDPDADYLHGLTLTADGFTEALRLTRDGGER